MSGSGSEGRGPEAPPPELGDQEGTELPFREGTMDAIVREAEAEPTPAEVVATAVEGDKREGGERHDRAVQAPDP